MAMGKLTLVKKGKPSTTVRRLVAKEVKKQTRKNMEKKVQQIDISFAPTTTPTFYLVSNIPLGDDFDERDGQVIRHHRVRYKQHIYKNMSATAQVHQTVRVVMFYSDITNADMAASLIINTADTSYPYNPLKQIFFRKGGNQLLWDKTFTLNGGILASSNFANPSFSKYWEKNTKLNGTCNFAAAAGTDGIKRNLWLMILSDEATGGDAPQLTASLRYVYRDP